MAKRGRKPQRITRVPQTPAGWEPPAHLTPAGAAVWGHLVGMLAERGNLGRTDPTLVEAYAFNVVVMRQAQDSINELGVVVENGHGAPGPNPACSILNMATMRAKSIIDALGLTPTSSRQSAGKDEPKQNSKWGGIFEAAV